MLKYFSLGHIVVDQPANSQSDIAVSRAMLLTRLVNVLKGFGCFAGYWCRFPNGELSVLSSKPQFFFQLILQEVKISLHLGNVAVSHLDVRSQPENNQLHCCLAGQSSVSFLPLPQLFILPLSFDSAPRLSTQILTIKVK